MNTTEIIFAARNLKIALSATREDMISYRPRSKMPSWLLEQIKANKESLLHDLLLADALRYIAAHYVDGADLSVLDRYEDAVNEVHADGSLEDLRKAVREYVRAARREFRRVTRETAA